MTILTLIPTAAVIAALFMLIEKAVVPAAFRVRNS